MEDLDRGLFDKYICSIEQIQFYSGKAFVDIQAYRIASNKRPVAYLFHSLF